MYWGGPCTTIDDPSAVASDTEVTGTPAFETALISRILSTTLSELADCLSMTPETLTSALITTLPAVTLIVSVGLIDCTVSVVIPPLTVVDDTPKSPSVTPPETVNDPASAVPVEVKTAPGISTSVA